MCLKDQGHRLVNQEKNNLWTSPIVKDRWNAMHHIESTLIKLITPKKKKKNPHMRRMLVFALVKHLHWRSSSTRSRKLQWLISKCTSKSVIILPWSMYDFAINARFYSHISMRRYSTIHFVLVWHKATLTRVKWRFYINEWFC